MREFNPLLWYGTRKLEIVPKHFVKGSTLLTGESKQWIEDKLIGRYSTTISTTLVPHDILTIVTHSVSEVVYFEDPKELTLYELYWAGRNNF